MMLGADPDSRAIIDSATQLAIQATGEILDLDPERPAVRLALRSWFGEATIVWLQDGRLFPAEDLVEMLMATLAELLRQAARLDPAFDPASVLTALGRPEEPTAAPGHG